MTNPKSPAWYGGGLDAIMVPGANLTDGAAACFTWTASTARTRTTG
jgi:hypothetical protein